MFGSTSSRLTFVAKSLDITGKYVYVALAMTESSLAAACKVWQKVASSKDYLNTNNIVIERLK